MPGSSLQFLEGSGALQVRVWEGRTLLWVREGRLRARTAGFQAWQWKGWPVKREEEGWEQDPRPSSVSDVQSSR